jgi:sigma-B regulation protein RsbU (phosphoserine phosphatase)
LELKDKTDVLRNCHFLAGVDEEVLRSLARETAVQTLEAGESLMVKGEHGSSMYFIVAGKVRVHDGEIVLAHLEDGEVFGEMAVLDSDVRSASVTTETEISLLSLQREALWRTVSRSPESLRSIIRSVLQRERTIVKDVTERSERLLAYEKELEIGRRIQADFLPESIPEIEGYEIASYFEAAREVAGDFFDVFELVPGKYLALVIGDVCDKGVGAALFMTLFRSLIRASCQSGMVTPQADAAAESEDRVEEIMKQSIATTNGYIATTHSKSSMFASVFFGVLDQRSGELIYINGGHESPVIYRADGSLEILDVTGGVLGLFPWAAHSVATVSLRPGDLIFTYTDGINEAKNEKDEQFSDERIMDMKDAGWESGKEFLHEILERIHRFRGEAPQSDDITMLALRSLGEQGG